MAGLLILVACGGGDVGSGGTGAPVTGLSVGTVNGFGSVIVDGVRFDDSKVLAVAETEPGKDVPAEVRLGDRVEVAFEQAGTATGVRVEAAVVGPVAGIDLQGRLTVLGQTVLVNADPAAGPVTQLGGGYLAASDVMVSDVVEVHGMTVSRDSGPAIQATRIERRGALPAFLKVTGTVSELGVGAASRFKIGTLTVDAASAAVLPAGTSLANGEVVAVLAAATSLTTGAGGAPQLSASQVRIRKLPDGTDHVYLGGAIAGLDTAAHTFVVDGAKVDYSAAALNPAGTVLINGMYVRVDGTRRADGTVAASAVMVRDGETESEAELNGTITLFDATTKTFVVRDVSVDASGASLEGCTTGLANGLFVSVHGDLSNTGVIATEVHCEDAPSGSIVEREGIAGSVDVVAKTFTITHDGRTLMVSWTADTYFRDVTPETLAGKEVAVEGIASAGAFVATKVKLEL